MEETKAFQAPEAKGVERFSVSERWLHWITAIAFMAGFFTGVGIAFPRFHWLLSLFGGGEFARWLHPWSGVVFAAGALLMFLRWGKEMILTPEDRRWLKNVKYYISGQTEKLPEAEKYNAGQKVFAWSVFLGGALFLLSGLPLWFPQELGIPLARVGVVIHEITFIVVGVGFLVHAYMGTRGVPGTLPSMIGGRVSAPWALHHHPKWFKGVMRRGK
jgi:formate dehydrogenase subunit gamma